MSKHSHPVSEPIFSEPTFEEAQPTPDPSGFMVEHPSDSPLYSEIKKNHLDKAISFKKSRLADSELFSYAQALGSQGQPKTDSIVKAKKIVFHSAGDTGSVKSTKSQNIVTDALLADCNAPAHADRPSFFYHLGDVVYSFGESQYYYDQFYEPYRDYPGPIFAIPGNHEGMVSPIAPANVKPLDTFYDNFCATSFGINGDAATIHRTAMTQPGVYFTLDAPFVRIIGLFSNALEDPGVISSEKGSRAKDHYTNVPDSQLTFLKAQVERIKSDKYKGCVLLTVHHPPFSWTPPPKSGARTGHGGSPIMLGEIDKICKDVGVYPHAVLSGHVHNYQRFTRSVKMGKQDYQVPFLIAGSGGHAVNSMVRKNEGHPAYRSPADHIEKGLILEKYNDLHYGYLRITVDADTLQIIFHDAESSSFHQSEFDAVTVDLKTHTLISSSR